MLVSYSTMKDLIPTERIEQAIFRIRGHRIMLDYDLAELYEVPTKTLNQAVKRNLKRFPDDFMFRLTFQEVRGSRSQFVTLKQGQNIKYRPYAFTEHGILMLSSVLNSERAVQVNIEIMRAFVKLREMIASNKDLAKRLDALEQKYDAQFKSVFDAIRELMTPSPPPKPRRIGFRAKLVPFSSSPSFPNRRA